ncbi:MAG: hypothetical protein ACYTAN_16885 [Planctomycetota bacterium]|jgi:anti-sigma-K factor RskA
MDVEERLQRFAPKAPPAALKSRVMEAAARRSPSTVWDRIWASRAFWSGAAAAVTAGLILSMTGPSRRPSPPAPVVKEPSELVRSLADALGNGPELERWLALRKAVSA